MRFRDVFIKDIKTVVYDVRSFGIMLIMPIVLMSILGMALQSNFGDETDSGMTLATIGIVKDYDYEAEMYKVEGKIDLTTYDEGIVTALDAENNFFGLLDHEDLKKFVDYRIMTKEEGVKQLENEALNALVILPKDFIFNNYMQLTGSRLISEIEYQINPDNDFVAGIVYGIIEGYVDMNNNIYAQQRVLYIDVLSKIPPEAGIEMPSMMDDLTDSITSIVVEQQSVHREEAISSFQYYAAAIMCMFLLYSAGVGGRALLMERKDRTIPRLSVSGNGLTKIVLSNYFRVMALAMMQSILMIVYSTVVLKVYWGKIMPIIVTIIISSMAIAAIGMFIAVITLISNNYKVANAFEFAVIYIMALIGGSFVPVESLPALIGKLGFLSLSGQALKIYIRGMYELPITDSLVEIGTLLAFTFIFMAISMIIIKRKGSDLVC